MAHDYIPSLPARPDSCTYISQSPETPQLIIVLTSGESMPMPKAMVQITTRNGKAVVNCFTIVFFTYWRVHRVYCKFLLSFESRVSKVQRYLLHNLLQRDLRCNSICRHLHTVQANTCCSSYMGVWLVRSFVITRT